MWDGLKGSVRQQVANLVASELGTRRQTPVVHLRLADQGLTGESRASSFWPADQGHTGSKRPEEALSCSKASDITKVPSPVRSTSSFIVAPTSSVSSS